MWTLLMECFNEVLEEWDDFDTIQSDLVNQYQSLQTFFENLDNTADIDENLFTISPESRISQQTLRN